MKIVLSNRQSGKTKLCIETLQKNPDAICFVCLQAYKALYPSDLQARVFSVKSHAYQGRPYNKAILDEVDMMDDADVWNIHNTFDIILATATPRRWITAAIRRHGFEELENPHITKSYYEVLSEREKFCQIANYGE